MSRRFLTSAGWMALLLEGGLLVASPGSSQELPGEASGDSQAILLEIDSLRGELVGATQELWAADSARREAEADQSIQAQLLSIGPFWVAATPDQAPWAAELFRESWAYFSRFFEDPDTVMRGQLVSSFVTVICTRLKSRGPVDFSQSDRSDRSDSSDIRD